MENTSRDSNDAEENSEKMKGYAEKTGPDNFKARKRKTSANLGRCIICYSTISQDDPTNTKKQRLPVVMDLGDNTDNLQGTPRTTCTSGQSKFTVEHPTSKLPQTPYNCLCSNCNSVYEEISLKQQMIRKLQQEITELQQKMRVVMKRSFAVASKESFASNEDDQWAEDLSDTECHLKAVGRAKECMLRVGNVGGANSAEQTDLNLNVQIKSECEQEHESLSDGESNPPAGRTEDITEDSGSIFQQEDEDADAILLSLSNESTSDDDNHEEDNMLLTENEHKLYDGDQTSASNNCNAAEIEIESSQKVDDPPGAGSVASNSPKDKSRWLDKQKRGDTCDALKPNLQSCKRSESYLCNHCGMRFKVKSNLIAHRRSHKVERLYPCHVCSETFLNRGRLNTHLLRKHNETVAVKIYECGLCKKKFSDKGACQRHENNAKMHEPKSLPEYRCEHCGKTFSEKLALTIHVTSQHPEIMPYKCNICSAPFAQVNSMKLHQIKDHNESITWKVHQCADCRKKFVSNYDLQNHKRRYHGPGEYSCDKCGYTFDKESRLHVHRKRDCGNKQKILKPWREDNGTLYYCNMEVRKTIENKYACPYDLCQCSYTSRKNLSEHIRQKHGENASSDKNEYQCEQCGKQYDKPTALAKHIKGSHEGGFSCDICGITRTTQKSIEYHKRVDHHGIRPHVCEHCGKAYGNRKSLIIHVRHHTGERPFACDLCPKAFINATNLTEHQKTHHSGMDQPRRSKKLATSQRKDNA